MNESNSKTRFAVVGLGLFAQTAILPAFANSERIRSCRLWLQAIKKAAKLGKRYGVPTFSYENYENLLASGDIDAVYIAVPNSEHCKFVVRAAHAGLHVLCEKPLAYTSADAQEMIDACRAANVRLMTAYRLHFEEGKLQAVETELTAYEIEMGFACTWKCNCGDTCNCQFGASTLDAVLKFAEQDFRRHCERQHV